MTSVIRAEGERRDFKINFHRVGKVASNVLWYGVVIVLALAVILPFIWMITTSLKGQTEVFAYPPTWIPKQLQWQNYLEVWKEATVRE